MSDNLAFVLPVAAIAILITTAIINYVFAGYDRGIFLAVGLSIALIMIVVNQDDRQLAITVGLICAGVDFVYETIGIRNGSWNYADTFSSLRVFGTPLELPIIYFSLGVILVFVIKWLDPYLD